MNKDLLDDQYGRFRELVIELVHMGHEVRGLCLSYDTKNTGVIVDSDSETGKSAEWRSFNAGVFKPIGLLNFVNQAEKITNDFKPDIILAFSDTLYAIIGVHLKKKMNVRCVIDLYDNFESYASAKIPFVFSLFKKSLKEADGITTNSIALKKKIIEEYRVSCPVQTLENGLPKDMFFKLNKTSCRNDYNLPVDARVIGTCGALTKARGIDILINSFLKLNNTDSELHLALAGKIDENVKLPQNKNIHYFGHLPFDKVPTFINALDLGIICNIDSKFGRYCFPQKIREFLACQVPIVAADIGPTHDLLNKFPECLYQIDNENDLISKISHQLKNAVIPKIPIPSWRDLAHTLERFLTQI